MGTVVGTIFIPVPVLGATVGSVVGSVGGKLVGGVAGIALSKILEVYETMKAKKIKSMSTIPQLMTNISPDSQIMRGLMALTLDRDEDERLAHLVEDTINGSSSPASLYPSLDEFLHDNAATTSSNFETAKNLATELFADDNAMEYFVLTPVPDENAHEEFASSTDLLVLRWSAEASKPWESGDEIVLDINDVHLNKK